MKLAPLRRWTTLALAALACQSSPAAPLAGQRIVVMEGQEAPGGGKFGGCEAPVIGMGGHIGFKCAVPGEGKAIFAGKPGELRRLVTEGEPVHGGGEGMKYRLAFLELWIDPDGGATFSTDGEWKGKPIQLLWPRCLISNGPDGELVPLAIQGMPMPHSPEGFVFDTIVPSSAYGWTVWRTGPKRDADTPENSNSVMAAKAGEIEVLLRPGIKPRGVDDARATLDDVAMPELGVAGPAGYVVQKASISDAEEGGTSNLLIGMVPGKGHAVLVRSGTASPVAGWHFDNFNHPSPDNSGALLFRGILKEKGSYESTGGFFYRDTKGKIRTVLKGGDLAPGTGGMSFKHKVGWAEGWLSPENGYALIKAELDSPDRARNKGYWLWSAETGKLEAAALWGMEAPGLGGGAAFKEIKGIAVNSKGQIALMAKLAGEDGAEGIWAGRPGALELVALENGVFEAEGKSHKTGGLRFAGGHIAGQKAALNDAGQLVYAVDLRDEGRALVMAEIGE